METKGFTTKFTLVLLGIFLTSTFFALLMKFLEEIGLWIGLGVSIAIIAAGFYFTKKNTATRYILWGTTGTVVIGIIGFVIGLQVISSMLEKSGF
jgi:Na+/melibiose symporter-like transporter